jgi:hypothetical protein
MERHKRDLAAGSSGPRMIICRPGAGSIAPILAFRDSSAGGWW